MVYLKSRYTITILFFVLGAFSCAGGLFVLSKLGDRLSMIEIRLLGGIMLLIFGVYFFQLSNMRHLQNRIDVLEKQNQKPGPNP